MGCIFIRSFIKGMALNSLFNITKSFGIIEINEYKIAYNICHPYMGPSEGMNKIIGANKVKIP